MKALAVEHFEWLSQVNGADEALTFARRRPNTASSMHQMLHLIKVNKQEAARRRRATGSVFCACAGRVSIWGGRGPATGGSPPLPPEVSITLA
ncbi:unnamed protein product [Danaus chrysippus]|uniref:(African queen) hypothetical protein n=1 Tax=Danaus chrysippus TaxID=151541 RepID=A0A8J2RJV3_9NEOP|nr:unnamed protein product [Danaus chrysippus]